MPSKLNIARFTDEELAHFAFYAGEAIYHPDPNYRLEFDRLAYPGAIFSLIHELQERRKADSEPVAEVVSIYGDPEAFGEREIRPLIGIQQMPYGTKLYRHAQPAPVVPDDVLDALQKVARIRLDMNDFDGDRRGIADCLCDAEEALIEVVNRRADMLQGGSSPAQSDCCPAQNSVVPAQSGNSPAIPDGYVMVPKEPTKEMINAGWLYYMGAKNPSSKGTYKAMLAAARQEGK